jgi:CRISPR-associated protein Cmr1
MSDTRDLVLEVTNSTPMLVGWYSPELVDPQGLRATEVKGIWRWWARAVIGGALYDECKLVGERSDEILRKPTSDEIKSINCLVGKILGLGCATREGAEASRFTLKIETLTQGLERRVRCASREEGYKRMELLSLGKGTMYYLPGVTFRITVDRVRSRYSDAENLAVKILVLALQLMGVGKGSRRGLGSLDLNSLDSRITIPSELRKLLDEVYNEAKDIVKKYAKECPRINVKPCNERSLPPMPVISKLTSKDVSEKANVNFNITSVYLIRDSSKDPREMFCDIHNFFVRSERCRKLYDKPKCYDWLRKEHKAWILGLPRTQKDRKTQIDTGYKIEVKDVDRRASPIIVSYHSESNSFGGGAFVTFILSADWPTRMKWIGRGRDRDVKDIIVNEANIISAMNTALKEFEKFVRKVVMKPDYSLDRDRVWP